MNREEIYNKLKKSPKNVRFKDLCRNAEVFGFVFKGGKGSHNIYSKTGVREQLNFQNSGGKAKPYQVKQFIKIIENYNLLEDTNE